MRFSDARPTHDLTYSDVFLTPSRSSVTSRLDVSLSPGDGTGATLPIVAANMNSVTGPRLAATLARRGGLGVLPQDVERSALEDAVAWVKAQPVLWDSPFVLSPDATVADALARVRDPELPVPIAAQVFVCQRPLETPTGRFIGVAGIQRLLREAPSKPLARCIDEDWRPVTADVSDREVAGRLAAYDVVAIPVTDEVGRLVGAVTIDDVLDRVLPPGWRLTHTSASRA